MGARGARRRHRRRADAELPDPPRGAATGRRDGRADRDRRRRRRDRRRRSRRSRPRVVVISFPHNPTTTVVTRDELQRLVDLAREHGFLLVHDFAYADIAFDGHRPPSVLAADGAEECAVELYSLTKSFSMAGWRVGFVLGRADVVGALAKLKSYLDYGTFQPIQIASIVALREASDYPAEVCEIYRSRRDALMHRPRPRRLGRRAAARDDVRLGADPRALRALGSLEFALRLARYAGVAVSPGIGFGDGGDGHVRFALVENEQRIGAGDARDQEAAAGLTSRRRRSFARRSRRRRRTSRRRRSRSAAPAATTSAAGARARRRRPRRRGDAARRRSRRCRRRGGAAIGPPRNASGATWPTIRPWVAPEKRPSVISATSSPSPSPTSARGDVQHLAHPRAARGALVADDDDVARLRSRAP